MSASPACIDVAAVAGLVGEELITVIEALTHSIDTLEALPERSVSQGVSIQRRRRLRDRLRKAI